MPVCDGVEAARRIRALEAERGYDVKLPSKPAACDVPLVYTLIPPFSSHRIERGLPRVHEETVSGRRNGCLSLETREQDRAFQHAPKIRTSSPNGRGHP